MPVLPEEVTERQRKRNKIDSIHYFFCKPRRQTQIENCKEGMTDPVRLCMRIYFEERTKHSPREKEISQDIRVVEMRRAVKGGKKFE